MVGKHGGEIFSEVLKVIHTKEWRRYNFTISVIDVVFSNGYKAVPEVNI
jgi:hypothetical protein